MSRNHRFYVERNKSFEVLEEIASSSSTYYTKTLHPGEKLVFKELEDGGLKITRSTDGLTATMKDSTEFRAGIEFLIDSYMEICNSLEEEGEYFYDYALSKLKKVSPKIKCEEGTLQVCIKNGNMVFTMLVKLPGQKEKKKLWSSPLSIVKAQDLWNILEYWDNGWGTCTAED